MHADDQHLLVVGAVEDADPPAFGQIARRAPEKVVLQLRGAGMLEAEDLAALRIDARHHVPDGAVFSGRVHRLKDQQQGIAVGRVVQLLQGAQLRNVLCQQLLIMLSSTCTRASTGVGQFLRLTSSPSCTRKSFESIFIFILSACPAVRIAVAVVARMTPPGFKTAVWPWRDRRSDTQAASRGRYEEPASA